MGARVTYPSVEAMLEPTELAGLLGRPVDSVALAPMTTVGSSSTESDFRGVFVDGEATPAAVLKIVGWSRDWHATVERHRRVVVVVGRPARHLRRRRPRDDGECLGARRGR